MKIIYEAFDGKIFENEDECKDYEANHLKARTIIFSGHSDDIVIITTDGKAEEYSNQIIHLINGEQQVHVVPNYNGQWSFRLQLVGDNIKIPDIQTRYEIDDNGYSLNLRLQVPVGTHMKVNTYV